MIEIELPAHLRTLGKLGGGRLFLVVEAPHTLGRAMDALEKQWPDLRGTLRDHLTGKRRPFIRFYACGQDLSLEAWDYLLPEEVVSGKEPLLLIGAIAGG